MTVALPDVPRADWADGLHESTVATSTDAGWTLTGRKSAALSGAASEDGHVLMLATTTDGVALFVVDSDQLTLTAADRLDSTRLLVDVDAVDARARLVAGVDDARAALSVATRRAKLAVAAEQVGIARTTLNMSIEHAQNRTQFERPIGSFQSIKHQCADAYLAAEFASAAVDAAVADPSDPISADRAFLTATTAARLCTETCIHIHGGLGFTWEHSAHRYWRRAQVNSTLFGSHAALRAAVLGDVLPSVAT